MRKSVIVANVQKYDDLIYKVSTVLPQLLETLVYISESNHLELTFKVENKKHGSTMVQ